MRALAELRTTADLFISLDFVFRFVLLTVYRFYNFVPFSIERDQLLFPTHTHTRVYSLFLKNALLLSTYLFNTPALPG